MKTLKRITAFVAALLLAGGCDVNDPISDGAPPPSDPVVTVYVAGDYMNGDGKRVACLWMDSKCTDLGVPGGTIYATGYSVAVSGGRVHVAGNYWNSDNKAVACLWTDGVRSDLNVPDGAGDVYGLSVAVGRK